MEWFVAGPLARFNPRSREGSDCDAPAEKKKRGSFNPRSREGCDSYTRVTRVRSMFQSTLP